MINPNKLTTHKLRISYRMNLKYPCNLSLKLLLTLQNRIEGENATIK
jgi:hypothetical protein